ncbi:MAG: hypothetical protein FDW93_03250 [Bergeyella sp.]|nr:hypothetical protein [Bergeyella sp.]
MKSLVKSFFSRLRESWYVLVGQKKTIPKKNKNRFPTTILDKNVTYNIKDAEVKNFVKSLSIEFIFSEFNEKRVNAGGADLSQQGRLDPSLSSLKKYFPNAKYTVYSDFKLKIPNVELKKIASPVLEEDKSHPRHFYHLSNFYKMKGLIDSDADIRIAIDSDMFVWSEEIYRLIYLTEKFGFCVPNTHGNSMNFEIENFIDTHKINDHSNGYGTATNITPITLSKKSKRGKLFYEKCSYYMEKEPTRASIALWKAAWETGIYPYVLPKEFCVCRGNEGIGNEILLHVGHPSVMKYYKIKL